MSTPDLIALCTLLVGGGGIYGLYREWNRLSGAIHRSLLKWWESKGFREDQLGSRHVRPLFVSAHYQANRIRIRVFVASAQPAHTVCQITESPLECFGWGPANALVQVGNGVLHDRKGIVVQPWLLDNEIWLDTTTAPTVLDYITQRRGPLWLRGTVPFTAQVSLGAPVQSYFDWDLPLAMPDAQP